MPILAMNFGERVAYAGQVAVIGLVTVFAALSLLWGVLVLFHLAMSAFGKHKKQAPPPTAAPVSPSPAKKEDDGALVAVITAAIAATLAAENGGVTPDFRVVSYRRSRKKF